MTRWLSSIILLWSLTEYVYSSSHKRYLLIAPFASPSLKVPGLLLGIVQSKLVHIDGFNWPFHGHCKVDIVNDFPFPSPPSILLRYSDPTHSLSYVLSVSQLPGSELGVRETRK